MTIYHLSSNGLLAGSEDIVDSRPIPPTATTVKPPDVEGKVVKWNGQTWEVTDKQ